MYKDNNFRHLTLTELFILQDVMNDGAHEKQISHTILGNMLDDVKEAIKQKRKEQKLGYLGYEQK